jgi:hypothetical protein
MAFRIARHERPFTIELVAILPEHLHVIWTLPSGDADFSGRWKRIKAHLTHRLAAAGAPVKRHRNGEYALWHDAFGSTRFGTSLISSGTSTTSTSIRSSTSWFVGCATGHIRRFTCLSGAVCCQPIGRATSTSP